MRKASHGQSLTEYGLIGSLVALASVGALLMLGEHLGCLAKYAVWLIPIRGGDWQPVR